MVWPEHPHPARASSASVNHDRGTERRQCLILRECRHLTFNGRLDEKATDLRSPDLARVPMMVKAQKAPSSVDVLLLGARARHVWHVASGATHLANVARQYYLAAYLQTLAMPMVCKEMANANIMHGYNTDKPNIHLQRCISHIIPRNLDR